MALVAYDNSDSSDYENDDDESKTVVTLNSKIIEAPKRLDSPQTTSKEVEPQDKDGQSLFNLLPQPLNKKPDVVEEDDEFLHKKEKNAVKPKTKITVPSLSDFRDVDSTPIAKPKTTNEKKSGLLSMLPQPRNAVTATIKSLIPHVLSKKPNSSLKKPKVDSKQLINDYSDDSDNDEVVNDFFSINKPVEIPDVDIPVDLEPKLDPVVTSASKPRGIESFFKKEEAPVQVEQEYEETGISEASSSYSGYAAESSHSNEVALDEEAIMKLCGTRGKRKREDIQIVDVNQQEVLAEARQWLLKGLMDDTTKRMSASKKKGNEPTTQQRRKHQITYLAHQAKANEAELQNQWANNRMSKRQTQAKYGF